MALTKNKQPKAYIHIPKPLRQARGKRVPYPIHDADGNYIAARGQIVTLDVMERARKFEKVPALLKAVGLAY